MWYPHNIQRDPERGRRRLLPMSSGETTGWQVHAIAQGSGGFLAAAPRGRSASPAVSEFSSFCLDEDAPVPGLVSVPCVCVRVCSAVCLPAATAAE